MLEDAFESIDDGVELLCAARLELASEAASELAVLLFPLSALETLFELESCPAQALKIMLAISIDRYLFGFLVPIKSGPLSLLSHHINANKTHMVSIVRFFPMVGTGLACPME